jgi:hypothetical protein
MNHVSVLSDLEVPAFPPGLQSPLFFFSAFGPTGFGTLTHTPPVWHWRATTGSVSALVDG